MTTIVIDWSALLPWALLLLGLVPLLAAAWVARGMQKEAPQLKEEKRR